MCPQAAMTQTSDTGSRVPGQHKLVLVIGVQVHACVHGGGGHPRICHPPRQRNARRSQLAGVDHAQHADRRNQGEASKRGDERARDLLRHLVNWFNYYF